MIPFPKIHIATSVLNRIMNTLEDTNPLAIAQETPLPPDPTALGLQIDEAAATPPMPAAAPEPGSQEEAMVGESLAGGSLFDGALL